MCTHWDLGAAGFLPGTSAVPARAVSAPLDQGSTSELSFSLPSLKTSTPWIPVDAMPGIAKGSPHKSLVIAGLLIAASVGAP